MAVTERDEDDAVVNEGRHGVHRRRFYIYIVRSQIQVRSKSLTLSTTRSTRRDEHGCVLARQSTLCPQSASSVPERLHPTLSVAQPLNTAYAHLPLGGEVSKPRRNTEDERVELGKFFDGDDGVCWLSGSVHLVQDFLRQSLRNPGTELGCLILNSLTVLTGKLSPDLQHPRRQT